MMNEKMLTELAEREAEVLKRNGWDVSVLRFRRIMRDIPSNQHEEFKKMVVEEYEKL